MSSKNLWLVLILLVVPAIVLAEPSWTRLPDVTGQPSGKPVKAGGGITAVGDCVYLIVGNNTLDFMKFSVTDVGWTALVPEVPINIEKVRKVKKGACILDVDGKVYLFKGSSTNEFYCFDPADDTWTVLPSPMFTKGIKGGFATAATVSDVRYIYAGSGSNTGEWKRFDIEANAWEAALPAALPVEKAKVGTSVAFDGAGILYLLPNGGKENFFWSVDLTAPIPEWTVRTSLPMSVEPKGRRKKVKEGGNSVWLQGKVYAVKGGNTKQFWAFDPVLDAWECVGEVGDGLPFKGIKCGTSLAVTVEGICCIIGNNTNEFWYYGPVGPAAHEPDRGVAGSPLNRPSLHLDIVPNPSRGAATVTCGSAVDVVVRNALGQVIRTGRAAGTFRFDGLAAGVYTVTAAGRGVTGSRQLVVTE